MSAVAQIGITITEPREATLTDVVVAAEGIAIVPESAPGFSWAAVFAGALVGSASIFFLLFLGAGVGLSLFTVPTATTGAATTGVTLGAIYFFVAQAFGLVIGGYLAGRLMGPQLESEAEEMFHASSHGLAVWALAVVMTTTMAAISGLVFTGAGLTAGATVAASSMQTQGANPSPGTSYWVDTIFRPRATSGAAAGSPAPASQTAPAEARAEAGRILQIGLPVTGKLSQADHDQLAGLVSQFTGVDTAEANARVDDIQMRIQQQAAAAAEAARRFARYLALWLAASLIFGALVASGAAVSGRWIDDKARMPG